MKHKNQTQTHFDVVVVDDDDEDDGDDDDNDDYEYSEKLLGAGPGHNSDKKRNQILKQYKEAFREPTR